MASAQVRVVLYVSFERARTVSEELQQRQVNGSFPAGVLLQSDAVSRGGKHFPAANRHQFAALVLPRHVVQNRSVVDEGVKLPACKYIVSLITCKVNCFKFHTLVIVLVLAHYMQTLTTFKKHNSFFFPQQPRNSHLETCLRLAAHQSEPLVSFLEMFCQSYMKRF